MNFHKTKILLEKINRLYTGMSLDADNINPIERDLMLNYLREFYESFYLEKSVNKQSDYKTTTQVKKEMPKIEKEVAPQEVINQPKPEVITPPPVVPVKSAVIEPVQPVVQPKPVVNQQPIQQPVAPTPPPVQQNPPVQSPPPPKVEKTEPIEPPKREIKKFQFVPPPPRRPSTPPPTSSYTPPPPSNSDATELFNTKSSNDLSNKIGLAKIADLKRAFGLNDKMMYTNELFAGNNNVFNETMDKLNSYSTFDQAKDYLIKNIANRYSWTHKNRSKLAKDFIKTISRKYI